VDACTPARLGDFVAPPHEAQAVVKSARRGSRPSAARTTFHHNSIMASPDIDASSRSGRVPLSRGPMLSRAFLEAAGA